MYNLGQYIYGDSPIHRLDPRIKVLSVIALSVMILKANLFNALLITTFIALTGATATLKVRYVADALKPLMPFLFVLFFLHLLFTSGRPIFEVLPGITATAEGLRKGLMTTWQFAALVAGASILTLTTSSSELISGIERLLRPFGRIGIPSHDIAVMISLALRFVPTLLEEAEKVKKAQLSRGADFGRGTVPRRIKAISSLAVPLVAGSFRRAEELAKAMEGRGYERGPRTYLKELRLAPSDYRASAIMIFFLTSLQFLNALI
jgi:biotin transport system permease protein